MNLLTLLPLIVLLIWNAALTFFLLKLFNHYNSFTKSTKKNDLVTALNELLKNTLKNAKDIKTTNQRLDQEVELSKKHFKKIGFKRFNPFTDTGGNQSFSLCLLGENLVGFVLSSLHSRENTRIYAKKLKAGSAGDQVLSKEEKGVIELAQKS